VAHTESFSTKAYFDGLRQDAQFGTSVLYSLFRSDVQRLTALGLSEGEAASCFRLAVNDMARLAQAEQVPEEMPMEAFLEQTTLAHALLMRPGLAASWPEHPLLDEAALRLTQQKAVVWSVLERLDPSCRDLLLTAPASVEAVPCAEALQEVLGNDDVPAEVRVVALQDAEGFHVWQYAGRHEQLYQSSAPAQPIPEEANRSAWRWAVLVLISVIVAYAAYQFFSRPKTLAELYASNFNPPRSLLADWEQRRNAIASKEEASTVTEDCLMFLREADAAYQTGDLRNAMDPLLLIVLDTASACQADAWLYLGIIQLRLKDPITAMQCFAKIEDLERFGEDVYWYQVMAYLQIAQNSPHQRERVAKAVELAIPNIKNPERRAQAQALLENLTP
jgi:tetratricopeptide (TPR) repeat protein